MNRIFHGNEENNRIKNFPFEFNSRKIESIPISIIKFNAENVQNASI